MGGADQAAGSRPWPGPVGAGRLGPVYRERASTAGAVVWTAPGGGGPGRVLPDGCMDLLWLDDHLVVAGPDTAAFWSMSRPGTVVAGLRFAPGTGPAVLGIPASAVRDQRVPLDAVWDPRLVRRLQDAVAGAARPTTALEAIARSRGHGRSRPDPLIAEVAARARRDQPVAAVADAVGLSPRQLHRRSLDAFGYGPKVLARVLRLQRALGLARTGESLAAVAAAAGYADQAHLSRDVRALAGATLGDLGLGSAAA